MLEQLKDVFAYNQMLISSVRKDLRTRYRGSILGFLWTFINPLMQLVVYTIVFPMLMRSTEENYLMYVFTGILPWIFFSTSLQTATSCILSNANLVKKIYFPRMILPISVATTGLVNFAFGLVIVFPALLLTGVKLTPFALLLPMVMLFNYIFIIGMCMILSSLYVYFRDLEHIIAIVTMMWFYLTPVLYNIDIFTGSVLKKLLLMNPMTQFITAYRNVLMYGKGPDALGFTLVSAASVAIFFLGAFIFSKLQKNFAEEL